MKFGESELGSRRFTELEPGEAAYATSTTEFPDAVYLFARRAGSQAAPTPLRVPESAIDRNPDVAGIEWLVTISGDLCPADE